MKLQIKRDGVTASEITISKIKYWGDYEIKYIRTEPTYRGLGLASTLLDRAKAKFPSLVAFLEDDGTGLTVDQMTAWYKRKGFKRRKYSFGAPWNRCFKTQWVMYWDQYNNKLSKEA